MVLAPENIVLGTIITISLVCDSMLILAFIKFKAFRKNPGIYLLVQSFCQFFFDFHFYSHLGLSIPRQICSIFGAVWISFFVLAWICNFMICLEVYLSLIGRIDLGHKRLFTFIVISSALFISCLLSITLSHKDPKSNFNTCSITDQSSFVLFITLPCIISIFLTFILILLSLYKMRKIPKKKLFLRYHLVAALIFNICIGPGAIMIDPKIISPNHRKDLLEIVIKT